jgi:hypothetical protein
MSYEVALLSVAEPDSRLFSPTLLKVKYLVKHWSDHLQILNLSLFEQTKLQKLRQPPMEDDLKYQKKNITATTVHPQITTYWILLKF